MFIHRLDPNGQASLQGNLGEDNFEEVLKRKQISWRKATKFEQFKHWDYLIKNHWKVDVKTAKRLSRRSGEQQYERTVLELWGSSKTNCGWLRGKADGIAFEQKDCWLIFRREDLLAYAQKKIEGKEIMTHSQPPELNQPYRRWNNEFEIFVWVEINDLLKELNSVKWNK